MFLESVSVAMQCGEKIQPPEFASVLLREAISLPLLRFPWHVAEQHFWG